VSFSGEGREDGEDVVPKPSLAGSRGMEERSAMSAQALDLIRYDRAVLLQTGSKIAPANFGH
jgi:hypothetical protein